jgi:hypothetical protein
MDYTNLIEGDLHLGYSRNLQFLENLLGSEIPVCIISVQYKDKYGFLTALHNRLLFSSKGLFSNECKEILYSNILTTQINPGIFTTGISIIGSGFEYTFGQIHKKEDAFNFLKKLNNLIDENKKPNQTAPKEDVFEKLKKLNELKNLGIISGEEFETQRKKFLDEM